MRELHRVRKEKKTKRKIDEKRKGGQVAEMGMKGRGNKQEYKRQGGGGSAALDSPPLGLISFCILCCVPAERHEHVHPENSNVPDNQSTEGRKHTRVSRT